MGMLYLIWRELGMGKFPHSWLSSHSEKEFPHSRLRRSWGNTLSLFLLSHSCGNFFSRLRGFATQGGKIPSLILSRWGIGHTLTSLGSLVIGIKSFSWAYIAYLIVLFRCLINYGTRSDHVCFKFEFTKSKLFGQCNTMANGCKKIQRSQGITQRWPRIRYVKAVKSNYWISWVEILTLSKRLCETLFWNKIVLK